MAYVSRLFPECPITLNIWTGHVDEKSNICIMYRCPAPNTFPSKTKYFFNVFFKMQKLPSENSDV